MAAEEDAMDQVLPAAWRGLSTGEVKGNPGPESFTQPAPYLDPAVYALTYTRIS